MFVIARLLYYSPMLDLDGTSLHTRKRTTLSESHGTDAGAHTNEIKRRLVGVTE
jgi:hypothetical protein